MTTTNNDTIECPDCGSEEIEEGFGLERRCCVCGEQWEADALRAERNLEEERDAELEHALRYFAPGMVL